jgi:hypothetical protein
VLTGLIKRIASDAETAAVDDQSAPDRLAIPEFITGDTSTAADATATSTGATA